MSLARAWDDHADQWIRWAREPGHDSYWQFHRDAFFRVLPPPGARTIDVGCGEGRVTRDLRRLGHTTLGIDPSPKMIAAAREADPSGEYVQASGDAIPAADASADLVVAFMVLMDVDDLGAVVRECARVLAPGGRLCVAITHGINSAGDFDGDDASSPFVIRGSYFEERRTVDHFERDGLAMTFHSVHRPLEAYSRALEDASLRIDAIREVQPEPTALRGRSLRWRRVPLFLHLRAVKAG